MNELTFNELPKAVSQLFSKLENIERLLQAKENEPKNEADQLLTIQQAAELLCLSVPTIYGLVARAAVPVCKKGKRLYFSKQELTDWIKAGRKKTFDETAAEAAQYLTRKKK
jgi:excisionase family DNA binding protein